MAPHFIDKETELSNSVQATQPMVVTLGFKIISFRYSFEPIPSIAAREYDKIWHCRIFIFFSQTLYEIIMCYIPNPIETLNA